MIRSAAFFLAVSLLPALLCTPAAAQDTKIDVDSVRAHEAFLASDALGGRGSGTRDEEIAATYVGSQFESYHLKPAPGLKSFVQEVKMVQPQFDGHAQLTVGSIVLEEGRDFHLLMIGTQHVTGTLLRVTSPVRPGTHYATGQVPLLDLKADDREQVNSKLSDTHSAGATLTLFTANEQIEERMANRHTRVQPHFLDGTAVPGGLDLGTPVLLTPAAAKIVSSAPDGTPVSLVLKTTDNTDKFTYNALGYLPGSDPHAGTLLITAHLDHLGTGKPVEGDSIYNGADDDASGTTAVLELAQALSRGIRLRRSVLFVCFGSEELGGFGNAWFLHHPPIPLTDIVANIEFEMIGAQDPKMPPGVLLLTGWDRSNLGPTLRTHGAKLGPDPYPEQHFFERSDNYALAKRGIVAQTAAGYGAPAWYHQPSDDLDHLNIKFMTSAIQSLLTPIRWLANSDFKPEWLPGKRP